MHNCSKNTFFSESVVNSNFFHSTSASEIIKYKELWKNVVVQALIDILSTSRKKRHRIDRIRAMQWLNSEDCHEVCELAGLDAGYIKRRLKLYLHPKENRSAYSKIHAETLAYSFLIEL